MRLVLSKSEAVAAFLSGHAPLPPVLREDGKDARGISGKGRFPHDALEAVSLFRGMRRTYVLDRFPGNDEPPVWSTNIAVAREGRVASLTPLVSGAMLLTCDESDENDALRGAVPSWPEDVGTGPKYLTMRMDEGEHLLEADDEDELRGLLGQYLTLRGGDATAARELLTETDPSGHEATRVMAKGPGSLPVCVSRFFINGGVAFLRHQRMARRRELLGLELGAPDTTCFAVLNRPEDLFSVLTDLSSNSSGFYALRRGDKIRQGS